ncbi:MAG: hypothetical protein V8T36_07800 [Ruthenibacterium lactatiformans]
MWPVGMLIGGVGCATSIRKHLKGVSFFAEFAPTARKSHEKLVRVVVHLLAL